MKVKSLSRVRLFATPRTAAYQAPPSMGFSRQEYWSGVPSPSLTLLRCYSIVLLPKCLVAQLCLCNPWDCSPSGSSVDRIFQARILKWVAIFSSRHLPDPGINLCLLYFLHCRQILYPLNHWGSPFCSSTYIKTILYKGTHIT